MIIDSRKNVYRYPENYLESELEKLKPYHPNAHIEVVRLNKLNLDDESLKTYHTSTWGPDPTLYRFDKNKIKDWNYAIPYASRKSNGLSVGDGRHRMRALMNEGYTHVPMIILN